MNQADQDFDKVAIEGTIKSIPGGRVGKTKDNRVINVRNKSSDGNKPTVEVYNPQTKKAYKI
nr:hypothetical protein [Pedobacter sp. ASV2]